MLSAQELYVKKFSLNYRLNESNIFTESYYRTDDSFLKNLKKMTITRRRFIRNLGIAAIAAVSLNSSPGIFGQTLLADGLFPVPPESFSDPLNYLTRAHFEPFVDTFVQVRLSEKKRIQLQLIEVSELKHRANEKMSLRGESFSLLFQDTRTARLPQDVYRIEHAALGEFSLLLVPTGIKGNRYEAIINRIAGSF